MELFGGKDESRAEHQELHHAGELSKDLAKVRSLTQFEKEGRAKVILPCHLGNIIWMTRATRNLASQFCKSQYSAFVLGLDCMRMVMD